MKRLLTLALTIFVVSAAFAQSVDGVAGRHKNPTPTKRISNDFDRVGITFLMGVDGLGDNRYNGFQTMDNAYGTRPWMNSWQLELTFRAIHTNHFSVLFGVGYESDVYKMDNEIVFRAFEEAGSPIHPNILIAADDSYLIDDWDKPYYDWETRLVTRYITIPLGIEFHFDDFEFGVTALPSFNYTSSNTGFKYTQLDADRPDWDDKMIKHLKPYKCDIRLEMTYSHIGAFVQFATSTIFRDMDRNDIYPLRAGLMLKL